VKVFFKTLRIQNFLSFGNVETVIDFTTGLNLFTGKNGAGKSSALLDAISYALYDKPYRKINKSELINRKNKKNLKVSLEFLVNTTEYKIVRGMKNSDCEMEFYIDGNLQKLLSSKSLSQDEIEQHVGIDYKLFKQIISLSINHNTPFLTLSSSEKRDLLEKFFNIDAIATMLKNAKEEMKNYKIRKDMLTQSIDMLADVIRSETKHIQEFDDSMKSFEDDKKNDLFEISEKISLNILNLKKIKKEAKAKKGEADAFPELCDVVKLRAKKDAINKKIIEYEYDIKNSEKLLLSLDSFDVCPTCNSRLTDEHKKSEVETHRSIILSTKGNIADEHAALKEILAKITSCEAQIEADRDIQYSIKYLKNQYLNIESLITKLNVDKEKIMNRKFVVDLDTMKDELVQKKKEYTFNKKELDEIANNISNYTKIISILSDTGVKSYIFDQLIPVLNKSINYYLNIFGLSVYIEFDSSMKDNIKTTTNFNSALSYFSFSEGEKKKIDMAILLSFIDVTKKVANWNCNLLIIDELLDSSIDEEGLEKMLESLDKMVNADNDMGIYIISHRFKADYKQFFNSMIEVSKNKEGFSKMVQI